MLKNQHMSTTSLIVASLVVATQLAVAQPLVGGPSTAARINACVGKRRELIAALADIHARQRNVGLSALISMGGREIVSTSLGHADLEHAVRVTPHTRFGVASITKAFTGVALLKLHESGRIDLDAPIQRYVPAFPEKSGGEITPRLLAAHLAGIRHWASERTPELYARHFDDINDIIPLFKDDTLVATPGTRYNYSSYGYNLLGAAIQSASEMPYQSYVERTVIAPLGLTATGFDDVRRVQPNRARRYSYFHPWTFVVDSHAVYRVPDWDYSHNMAGGNMYATAADLVRLGRALIRPGLLTQASLDLLYRQPKVGAVSSRMSFGFFVRDSAGVRRINIGGSNAGVQSALYIYPDYELVIAVLSNAWGIGAQSGEMTGALPERLAAICLGDRP